MWPRKIGGRDERLVSKNLRSFVGRVEREEDIGERSFLPRKKRRNYTRKYTRVAGSR